MMNQSIAAPAIKSPGFLQRIFDRMRAKQAGVKSIVRADEYVGPETDLAPGVGAIVEGDLVSPGAPLVENFETPAAALPVVVTPAAMLQPASAVVAPAIVEPAAVLPVVAAAAAPVVIDDRARCLEMMVSEKDPRELGRLAFHLAAIEDGEKPEAFKSKAEMGDLLAALAQQAEQEQDPKVRFQIAEHAAAVERGEADGLFVKVGSRAEFKRLEAMLETEQCPRERGRMAMHLSAMENGEATGPFMTRAEAEVEFTRINAALNATDCPRERWKLAEEMAALI